MNVLTQAGMALLAESAEKVLKIEGISISVSKNGRGIDFGFVSKNKIVGQALTNLYLGPDFYSGQRNYRLSFQSDYLEETSPLLKEARRIGEATVSEIVDSRAEWKEKAQAQEFTILRLRQDSEDQQQEINRLSALLEDAINAMEAAHDSLFSQACSNPITTFRGEPLDCTKLNELSLVARRLSTERHSSKGK